MLSVNEKSTGVSASATASAVGNILFVLVSVDGGTWAPPALVHVPASEFTQKERKILQKLKHIDWGEYSEGIATDAEGAEAVRAREVKIGQLLFCNKLETVMEKYGGENWKSRDHSDWSPAPGHKVAQNYEFSFCISGLYE